MSSIFCFWTTLLIRSRQYEIYGNTVDNAVPRYAGVSPRGGDGVIFSNRFSFNVTNDVLLTNEGGCVGTYPLPDQIRNLYIWNNTVPAPVRASFCNPDARVLFKLNR